MPNTPDESDRQRQESHEREADEQKRVQFGAVRVDPDSFDMEAAIALWEKMTGKTFTGNRVTG